MLHVLGAWMAQASKHVLSCPLKLDMFQWVVGFKVQVLRLMFYGTWSLIGQNERQTTTKTWHLSVSISSSTHVTCAWKPMPSHLKANGPFMTWCWNNVKDMQKTNVAPYQMLAIILIGHCCLNPCLKALDTLQTFGFNKLVKLMSDTKPDIIKIKIFTNLCNTIG